MDFLSFSLPATRHLAISPTATGQPLFLKDAQNPHLLELIKMELLVVEDLMGIMRITVDGYGEEHMIRVSLTSPV